MAAGRLGAQLDSGTPARAIELVGDSPELVALALLRQIAQIEGLSIAKADRRWILETYGECLEAVRGGRSNDARVTPKRASR